MSDLSLTPEQAAILRAQFDQYESADIRRITFLTVWSVTLLYLFLDLLLRWAYAREIGWARWMSDAITMQATPLTMIYIAAVVLIWIGFFGIDTLIEEAGSTSWLYRFGSLSFARPFCAGCLVVLLIAGVFAVQAAVSAPSFWLLETLWVMTLLVCLVEDWQGIAERGEIVGNRTRRLLRRVPLLGRFVIVRRPRVPPQPPTPEPAPGSSPSPPSEAAEVPHTPPLPEPDNPPAAGEAAGAASPSSTPSARPSNPSQTITEGDRQP